VIHNEPRKTLVMKTHMPNPEKLIEAEG